MFRKDIVKMVICLFILCTSSCQQAADRKKVFVKNTLGIDRKETITIAIDQVADIAGKYGAENLLVREEGTDKYLVCQLIDEEQDGKTDQILFQVEIKPNEEKQFVIEGKENGATEQPESELTTYSKFVPERIDDYAWENDRIAFRTYGPEAQRLVDENEPGGTLSSGIDLWLKRVNYSVIDKWYAKNTASAGYYHIDHGEGYDPYHVGASRGCGGIGVWLNDSLQVSKNFISYKTIATGPIRTIFELTYAPWSEFDIKETKRISLDLNTNFSKFEILLESGKDIPNWAIGVTLHEGKGDIKINAEKGLFRHWEPIDDSYLGEGIIIDPNVVDSAFTYHSPVPDQSQVIIVTDPKQSKLIYYAGFGWTKSGQVKSQGEWDALLEKQALILANPLAVKIE